MCVIIYIPTGESITYDELKAAWDTNPHGAGYAYLRNGQVLYHRGFMRFSPFYDEIKSKIGKNPLLLHFRITTSNVINKLQTHPYDPLNITRLKDILKDRPAVCMNGSITGQTCYKHYNDTMSYIKDHKRTFKLISNNSSSDTLNIVEDATGSRWALLTPNGILLSHGFKWVNGKAYSNTNHLWSTSYYPSSAKEKVYLSDQIKKPLLAEIFKDKNLYYKTVDHVEFCCNYSTCWNCYKCLRNCESLEEIEETVNWSLYY